MSVESESYRSHLNEKGDSDEERNMGDRKIRGVIYRGGILTNEFNLFNCGRYRRKTRSQIDRLFNGPG